MTWDGVLRGLAIVAIAPASASVVFVVFWRGFEVWRRHRVATWLAMLSAFYGTGAMAYVWRDAVLAVRWPMPSFARALGWTLMLVALAFGTVADRQIGLRVRSFAPLFDQGGRIRLVTTGAYGVVRHPIYASGIWFELGAFLATGYGTVAAACVVLTIGATWFTRQEERRLVGALEDPAAYERYRARVGALFPRMW